MKSFLRVIPIMSFIYLLFCNFHYIKIVFLYFKLSLLSQFSRFLKTFSLSKKQLLTSRLCIIYGTYVYNTIYRFFICLALLLDIEGAKDFVAMFYTFFDQRDILFCALPTLPPSLLCAPCLLLDVLFYFFLSNILMFIYM